MIAVPSIKKVLIHSPRNHENALNLASNIKGILKNEFDIERELDVIAEKSLEDAVKKSDIIITATPSREAMIKKSWVQPGTHFSCVGADMPGKKEIDSQIFVGARVFVDDLKQCMNIGEIELPIKERILKKEDIVGEIGDIINGRVEGRLNNEQVTIFDATGTVVLDLITAQLAFEKSNDLNMGVTVNL